MGLLKRLFSIGGKKNKKKRHEIIHNVPLPEQSGPGLRTIDEEEHEAAVGRLLRSSSTRFAVVSEVDYASLPPLPHPINDVIQPPAASSVSLASSTISQRGTYSVTVHTRKRHTSTEFSNTNRELDDRLTTPSRNNDQNPIKLLHQDSRALGLRSDPSVASLLDMYDEHGRLPSKAFSNSPPSPPRQERVQCRRNGSTLRQLLGAPSSLTSRKGSDNHSTTEGDISWAERFLGETDGSSINSSIGPYTPTPDNQFSNEPSERYNDYDISISNDDNFSANLFENPAISSMDVELSITSDSSQMFGTSKPLNPYGSSDPMTPQRASQVFSFLTQNRQSKQFDDPERPLPDLPSAFSSPSSEGAASRNAHPSRFSPDSSMDSAFDPSTIQFKNYHIPRQISSTEPSNPTQLSCMAPPAPRSSIIGLFQGSTSEMTPAQKALAVSPDDQGEIPNARKVKVLMSGPTKVIVTAPTPSANHETPSRVPRGPRSLLRKRSSHSIKEERPTLVERSNSTALSSDSYTALPARRKGHRRTASLRSTSTSSLIENDIPLTQESARAPPARFTEKENNKGLSVASDIPLTPLRSNNAMVGRTSSLFRTAVHQGTFRPPVGMTPSPTSSSEMSPVGRQLMLDVRQQRMKAREAERERSGNRRFGSGRSALRI
ncbi:uncharacterized protein LACBIDRAFT_305368 [Laccaria bicolor S238N-H82]|uniref:Predicted protein n=1 Tax=Laccaria bicolor (strain S238N-H82 / ATCC MYA-4686) TaxID=486041 RepID=B0CU24_LACBS|nr:uncharacterized protein LACBIDRAFT_305368 [Laccaria bicolor S238N-H82]EDR14018.1 predicted protein [Laccaria bicolor S238N-H82]|eukprot:XP_001874577.1 predicted protein [Laccaria bicolor S238N-H82]